MKSIMTRVPKDTYDELRAESVRYQKELDRQVSMGELITVALRIAKSNRPEMWLLLRGASFTEEKE